MKFALSVSEADCPFVASGFPFEAEPLCTLAARRFRFAALLLLLLVLPVFPLLVLASLLPLLLLLLFPLFRFCGTATTVSSTAKATASVKVLVKCMIGINLGQITTINVKRKVRMNERQEHDWLAAW